MKKILTIITLLIFLPNLVLAVDCVGENEEYVENTGKQCCSGLEKKISGTDVQVIGGQPYTSNKYKCIKPTQAETKEQPQGTPAPKIVIPELQIPIGKDIKFSAPTEVEIGGVKYLQIPWIAEYISAVYNYVLGIVGIVAVIMIAVGGVIWLTAGGSPDRVKTAKDYISGAIIGLFLALGSYVILYTINPALLTFEPLSIRRIETAIEAAKKAGLEGSVIPCKYDKNNLTGKIDQDIINISNSAGVDPLILASIFKKENLNSSTPKRGPCGEVGVTQLMPSTLDGLGFSCCVSSTDGRCGSKTDAKDIGSGTDQYSFTCDTNICGHCAQANTACVDYFNNPNNTQESKKNSMLYSAKLIKQQILPKSKGDIALTFAAYNGGKVKNINTQAIDYAEKASQYYNEFCKTIGGTQEGKKENSDQKEKAQK